MAADARFPSSGTSHDQLIDGPLWTIFREDCRQCLKETLGEIYKRLSYLLKYRMETVNVACAVSPNKVPFGGNGARNCTRLFPDTLCPDLELGLNFTWLDPYLQVYSTLLPK